MLVRSCGSRPVRHSKDCQLDRRHAGRDLALDPETAGDQACGSRGGLQALGEDQLKAHLEQRMADLRERDMDRSVN
jgi:hypothetical protein